MVNQICRPSNSIYYFGFMNIKINRKQSRLWCAIATIKLSTLLAWMTLIFPSVAQTPSWESLRSKFPETIRFSGNKAFEKANIFFDEATDTILISGQTELEYECTFEARIYIPESVVILRKYRNGLIFDEYTEDREHKVLRGGKSLSGKSFPSPPQIGSLHGGGRTEIKSDRWQHIAFVQNIDSQSLYLNGRLIVSRPIEPNTDIGDGEGVGYVGATPPHPKKRKHKSFLGHIDSLRLSKIARYRGNKFEPPAGKMAADEHTVLLYNFELEEYFQRDGFIWVKDLSGSDRHGKLGTDIDGATSPSIVVFDRDRLPPQPQSQSQSQVETKPQSFIIVLLPIIFGVLLIGSSAIYLYKSQW